MKGKIKVNSEIGKLKRLMVHSPDAGIGKVAPSMKEELLYDDIVYLKEMREEYNHYLETLLWFLDPECAEKMKDHWKVGDAEILVPSSSEYFSSDKVVDVEHLLYKILDIERVRASLVSAICALEQCTFRTLQKLLQLSSGELARVLITGSLMENGKEIFLFSPVPNLIFTRDIGIVIDDHLLLSKPAEKARSRESILTKYIAFFHLFEDEKGDINKFSDKIIELHYDKHFMLTGTEEERARESVSVEGGDVMMISPRHLLIGQSVRTTARAIDQVTRALFEKDLVDKVSVVQIPEKRDFMHIDTVFTMIRKDLWILFYPFSGKAVDERKIPTVLNQIKTNAAVDPVNILQFGRGKEEPNRYNDLEELFKDISINELDADPKKFEVIYCAEGEFPYGEREQWTDACNFLAIQEGIIIGYNRNTIVAKQLQNRGFNLINSEDFINKMRSGKSLEDVISSDTLILLPSSELSRARGGTHCMSLPLLRENLA